MKNIYKILIVAIVLIIAIAGAFTLFGKTAPAGEGPSYNASALSQKISLNFPVFEKTGIRKPKKKRYVFFWGYFYCTVVPTIFNPSLRMFIAAFLSRS